MMSSAAGPENIPGIAKAIPDPGENRSPSARNSVRGPRNRFSVHPGIPFALPQNPQELLMPVSAATIADGHVGGDVAIACADFGRCATILNFSRS